MKIEQVDIKRLRPSEDNAKIHTREQVEQIKKSIQEFGFNDPLAIDENDTVIEGHGRLLALQELGYKKVECIRLAHLTPEQKKAYIQIHNQLTMNTGFDLETLEDVLADIQEIDMSEFGFEFDFDFSVDVNTDSWFDSRKRNDRSTEGETDEYKSFVEKFEEKKDNRRLLHPRPRLCCGR